MLLFRRNESDTMRPSNILMMSRFSRTSLGPPVPGWCRWRSEVSSTISYLVNGALIDGGRAEEAHDGAAGPQHPDDLPRERLRRRLGQEIEEVPAQDAVHARVRVVEARLDRRRQLFERPAARVPIVVGEQIFDEELAAEPLAEERDVGADHGAEIDERGSVGLVGDGREKLRKGFRRDHRPVAARTGRVAFGVGLTGALPAPAEKV